MVIERNNLITVLPHIEKEFKISFAILISKYGADWQSVIHFTEDGNFGIYGDRIPGLWFSHDKKLHVGSALNGNYNYVYAHHTVLQVEKWINLEISQTLINNKARRQFEEEI